MQFLKHGQNTPGMDSIFRGIRGFPVTAETESSRHARQLPLNPLCGHPVHPRALQPRPLAPLRAHGAAESLAGRRPRTPHPTIQSSLGPRDTASPDATRADGPPSGSELDLRAANQRLEREKRPHLCRRSEKCKILTGIRHRYSEVGVSDSQTPVEVGKTSAPQGPGPPCRHGGRFGVCASAPVSTLLGHKITVCMGGLPTLGSPSSRPRVRFQGQLALENPLFNGQPKPRFLQEARP